jgi:hypothetical protein
MAIFMTQQAAGVSTVSQQQAALSGFNRSPKLEILLAVPGGTLAVFKQD